MNSFLIHGLLAALMFWIVIWLPPVVTAALVGIFYYLGREGLDAQIATGLSKKLTPFLPFQIWAWPLQMLLDVLGPIVFCTLSVIIYLIWF